VPAFAPKIRGESRFFLPGPKKGIVLISKQMKRWLLRDLLTAWQIAAEYPPPPT